MRHLVNTWQEQLVALPENCFIFIFVFVIIIYDYDYDYDDCCF